jgi:hypothetical protein
MNRNNIVPTNLGSANLPVRKVFTTPPMPITEAQAELSYHLSTSYHSTDVYVPLKKGNLDIYTTLTVALPLPKLCEDINISRKRVSARATSC